LTAVPRKCQGNNNGAEALSELRVFAIEASWPESEAVDDYVRVCHARARQAAGRVRSAYMHALIEASTWRVGHEHPRKCQGNNEEKA